MIGIILAATLTTAPIAPDSIMTPGAINSQITQDNIATTICVTGYTARQGIRNVPEKEKKQVYLEYHYDKVKLGLTEVDHLISLELGGSNDIHNLWPESYITKPLNAHTKDNLENHLHRLVCSGKVTLHQAQYDISKDWVSAYSKYVGPLPK